MLLISSGDEDIHVLQRERLIVGIEGLVDQVAGGLRVEHIDRLLVVIAGAVAGEGGKVDVFGADVQRLVAEPDEVAGREVGLDVGVENIHQRGDVLDVADLQQLLGDRLEEGNQTKF